MNGRLMGLYRYSSTSTNPTRTYQHDRCVNLVCHHELVHLSIPYVVKIEKKGTIVEDRAPEKRVTAKRLCCG